MIGVGAFKKHTRILVNMSKAYVENRGVWINCSYIKGRNDYIKTRDSITDSIVFHFDSDCDVQVGDVLVFNGTRFVLGNLTDDTFFHTVMRQRSAGIELHYKGALYSVASEHNLEEGDSSTPSLISNNVWFAMQRNPLDGERDYVVPYTHQTVIISCVYNVKIGNVLVSDFGTYYIRDIDYKMPGTNALSVIPDTRDLGLNG